MSSPAIPDKGFQATQDFYFSIVLLQLQAVEEDVIQNSISILNNTQRLAEDM